MSNQVLPSGQKGRGGFSGVGQGSPFPLIGSATSTDYIPFETLGGSLNDAVGVSNSLALNNAEASLLPGQVIYFRAGTWNFHDSVISTRAQMSWMGDGEHSTFFNWVGANIGNMFRVGTSGTPVNGALLRGFSIISSTKQTAGYALLLTNCQAATVEVSIQPQLNYTAANNVFNGLYANHVDNVKIAGREFSAQSVVISVNGAVGGTSYKSDLWIDDNTKIFGGTIGVLCGGAFGGLYIKTAAIGVNGKNVVIDQSLSAEANREVFLLGTILDSSTIGANLSINDPGGVFVEVSGGWNASAATHGIEVLQNEGRVVIGGGVIIFQNGLVSGGDGIIVSDPLATVLIGNAMIVNNHRYGINPAVANNGVAWGNCVLRDNVTAPVNLTNTPILTDIGGYNTSQRLTATVIDFDPVNHLGYLQAQGNGFDLAMGKAGCFLAFDTVNNAWSINTNSVLGISINALGGMGFFSHGAPVAQPAAPVTLADVIAIIRGCGLSA